MALQEPLCDQDSNIAGRAQALQNPNVDAEHMTRCAVGFAAPGVPRDGRPGEPTYE